MPSPCEHDLFDRASQVFLDALECESAGERAAFVGAACGRDALLRAEVEALLAAQSDAADFLETTAYQPEWGSPPPDIGYVVGSYYLEELLGEGGMGVVYRARQLLPMERVVALKIVRPGLTGRDFVERFKHERQALARMDHENIARVLDGGETEGGLPYLVMEIVRGPTLTAYCAQHNLPVNERVRLCIQACQGIEHAHQNGIIHRDVKPSNLLVATRAEGPIVKVIDFGVAKAVDFKLSDRTLTQTGHCLVGTLPYMSPEQLRGEQSAVDTRSDIYAMGVVLYELLTGSPPTERDQLEWLLGAPAEAALRQPEAVRPSSQLRARQSASLDDARRMPFHAEAIPRDLDLVTLKALARDPQQRYQTTREFAADLQRYLRQMPVEVVPPSLVYRCRKFVARHPLAAASIACALVALLTTLVATSWAAIAIGTARRQGAELATSFISGLVAQSSRNPAERLATLGAYSRLRPHLQAAELNDTDAHVRSAAIALLADVHYREAGRVELPIEPGGEPPVAAASDLSHLILQQSDNSLRLTDSNLQTVAQSKPLDARFELRFVGADRYVTAAQIGSNPKRGPRRLDVYRIDRQGPASIQLAWSAPTEYPQAHDLLGGKFAYATGAEKGGQIHYLEDFDRADTSRRSWTLPARPRRLYWRPPDGRQLLVLTNPVRPAARKANQEADQASAYLCDPAADGPLRRLGDLNAATIACWTSDGRYLATADEKGAVCLWDFETATLSRQWKASGLKLVGLRFDPTDRLLATSGFENVLRLWDPWNVGLQPVRNVASLPIIGHAPCWFDRRGQKFAYVDGSQLVRCQLVDSAIYRFHPTDRLETGTHAVDLTEDGQLLAIAGEGWAAVHDAKQMTRRVYLPGAARKGVAFQRDGSRLLTHAGDQLTLWRIRETQQQIEAEPLVRIANPKRQPLTAQCLLSRITRGKVAAVLNASAVGIFSVGDDTLQDDERYFKYDVDIHSLDLSSNGLWLAVGGRRSGPVIIQSLTDPPNVVRLGNLGHGNKSVRFGSSGARILVGTPGEYRVLCLDGNNWKVESRFECGLASPAAAFNHDESMIANVNRHREIEIRVAPDFSVAYRLTAPVSRWTASLVFAPDDETLYVPGHGGVRVWDLRAVDDALADIGLAVP